MEDNLTDVGTLGHSNVKVNPAPRREFLHEAFEYFPESGELRWKARPLHHFWPGRKWSIEASMNRWNALYAGKRAGCQDKNGRRAISLDYDGQRGSFLVTRIIFAMMGVDVPDGYVIDHINRNPGDDRWENLRVVTQGENSKKPEGFVKRVDPRIKKTSPQRTRQYPSKSFLDECFSYDPSTGDLTWRQRPRAHFKTNQAWSRFNSMYSGKVAGSRVFQKRKQRRQMVAVMLSTFSRSTDPFPAHALIWIILGRPLPKTSVIDHIDGDAWNNRLNNLRLATRRENSYNVKRRRDKRDGLPKGISQRSSNGFYTAQICKDGVSHWLGTFLTLEAAEQAYKEAARLHFGEFATHLCR